MTKPSQLQSVWFVEICFKIKIYMGCPCAGSSHVKICRTSLLKWCFEKHSRRISLGSMAPLCQDLPITLPQEMLPEEH